MGAFRSGAKGSTSEVILGVLGKMLSSDFKGFRTKKTGLRSPLARAPSGESIAKHMASAIRRVPCVVFGYPLKNVMNMGFICGLIGFLVGHIPCGDINQVFIMCGHIGFLV